MITIQYQILRYLPDRVSGEFVNLGIVAFDSPSRSLRSRFINRIGNISTFFPNTNSKYLIKTIKTIQDNLEAFSVRLNSEFTFSEIDSIEEITRTVLPKDDSSLVFSEIKKTLEISVEATVSDLFSRFVSAHYMEDEDEEVRKDKEVWTKVYKKHFDEYGISDHLTAHTFKTRNDELEFDKAWKNGAWNCFESVSFNLTRPDSIKNKVYKWVGKLDELTTAQEPMHIYLLSVLPIEHTELDLFISNKIKEKATENVKIDLILEDEIDLALRTLFPDGSPKTHT
jgi:hypothetical protein